MKKTAITLLMIVVLLCGCSTTPKVPAGRSQGEAAPVFRANRLLPKEVLRGSNYRIAERVPVEEYQYVFTVKSDFGVITARGRDMLDLRLRELKSIEAAQELSTKPHVVDGILEPLKSTGKGLELLITEPLESLGRVPKGFGLMANQYLDPADRRAGSSERRKLANELDCDPETTNPVLKKLLDEMAIELGSGSLLTQATMSFVPGLSVLPTTAQMKETIANNPPSAINDEIDKELEAADVEKSIRSRFRYSAAYTTMQRLQLIDQFRALDGVKNRAALIESAAEAHTEAEALSSIHEGKMLVDLREQKPIRRLEFVGLPLAVLNDGTHVVVCPYDYLTNTQELGNGVAVYRTSNPNVTTVLLTAGRASPAAQKTLELVRFWIVEKGTPRL
ncbi:MAG: hypothetical protein JSU72_18835 [Deltaproteobacteria bacterium]|nr:MAG: hypothetical protein JSU72_18835 [Deltaproteobacteria bacterium]